MAFVKLAVFALVAILVEFPINGIFSYALLVLALIIICVGQTSHNPKRWAAAVLLVALILVVQMFVRAPRIEEGHNVFLPDASNPAQALKAGLPEPVFRFMSAQFDVVYPPSKRCDIKSGGCWLVHPLPDRTFAFSSDGIFDRPAYSRRVKTIDFVDPTWLRLGFINDQRYDWRNDQSDVVRGYRDQRIFVLHRFHLTMPWFVMYQFPADFAGSSLCWRGHVLWEQSGEIFSITEHKKFACRILQPEDIGRRIFGAAIQPGSLEMRLDPALKVRTLQLAGPLLSVIGAVGLLIILVRWRAIAVALPVLLIGLACVFVILIDASLFGGLRYLGGAGDGIQYEDKARKMLEFLLDGNFREVLRGDIDVFYLTPGLRYFRFVERFIFGDTNFGYLSLLLLMPILLWKLSRRFLPPDWAIAFVLIFLATPVGLVFGTTFFLYVENASQGYADSAAAILSIAGLVLLLPRSGYAQDGERFTRSCCGAVLLALGVLVRPNLALLAIAFLTGAGLVALYRAQALRVLGLSIGAIPMSFAAIHNWYFGNVFVPFSSNATHPEALVMPPSAYIGLLSELLRLNFSGENMSRAAAKLEQVWFWFSGPMALSIAVPLHAASIVVLFRVALARRFDEWLRLLACAAIAGHCMVLFYFVHQRYYHLFWLLTAVVATAWMQCEAVPFVRNKYPNFTAAVLHNPASRAIASLFRFLRPALKA